MPKKKGLIIIMGEKKILIVEDEKNIARLLAFNVERAGYLYDIAYDGKDGLDKALNGEFDLILLDLMLPIMDGFEVCRKIREKLSTPIIIVTAREEEVDKLLGFDLGADDYVTKPFEIKVLLSRIKANIRRASNEVITAVPEEKAKLPKKLCLRELTIDLEKYQVFNKDRNITLTKKEYELLRFLVQNPETIYSREQLLEKVWGYEGFYGDIRTVDVTVRRLREKLENDATEPEYLFTKRGVGYYVK